MSSHNSESESIEVAFTKRLSEVSEAQVAAFEGLEHKVQEHLVFTMSTSTRFTGERFKRTVWTSAEVSITRKLCWSGCASDTAFRAQHESERFAQHCSGRRWRSSLGWKSVGHKLSNIIEEVVSESSRTTWTRCRVSSCCGGSWPTFSAGKRQTCSLGPKHCFREFPKLSHGRGRRPRDSHLWMHCGKDWCFLERRTSSQTSWSWSRFKRWKTVWIS